MNIVHVVSTGGIYGKEQVILNLAEEQLNADHTPIVFTMGNPDLHLECVRRGLETTNFPNGAEGLISTLWDDNNNSKMDIIHTHDYKSGIIVAQLRGIDRLKCPVVRTLHGYTSVNKPLFSKIRFYEWLDKVHLRWNDANVGVSYEMNQNITIPNGIIPFHPDHDNVDNKFWDMSRDNMIIMCSARLSAEKNLDSLVAAIHMIRCHRDKLPHRGTQDHMGIKLLIFGEGPERAFLEQQIEYLGMTPEEGKLDEVYLMGFNPHARDYLRIANVYVQPSYTEGLPMAVLEAMNSRVLMFLSDRGGMSELIKTGAAIDCGIKPDTIAHQIIEWENKTGMERFGVFNKAHTLFHSSFTSKVMSDRYLGLYQRLRG